MATQKFIKGSYGCIIVKARSLLLLVCIVLLFTSGVSAYQTLSYQWDKDNFGNAFVIVQIGDSIPEEWDSSLGDAANTWGYHENFTYSLTYSERDTYLSRGSIDGKKGVLAETTANVWGDLDPSTIESGNVKFDQAEDWSTDVSPASLYVEGIAAHELGHLLGLAHTDVNPPDVTQKPTMIPGVDTETDDFLDTLEQDDKNGIDAIY